MQFRSLHMTIIAIAAPRGVTCHIDDDDDDDDEDFLLPTCVSHAVCKCDSGCRSCCTCCCWVSCWVSCCRVAAAAAVACHLLPINTTTCRWQSRWWTKAGNVAKKQCNARRRKEGGWVVWCSRGRQMKTRARGTCQKAEGKLLNKTAKRRRRSVKIN